MESYRVFISSIMNRSTEDLLTEREAARVAVECFAPITTPWAFEAEPASSKALLDFYIDGVKTSDVFVLIVGQRLTTPVKDEYDAARDHGKPILVFAKTVPLRDVEVDDLLRTSNVKYDAFANAAELRERVRRSLGTHILALIRGDSTEAFRSGDRLGQLRTYARNHTAVQITPLMPACQYNSFRVKAVHAGVLTLEKDSNHQTFTVPAQRVEDILGAGQNEFPTVVLEGRLQWVTIPQVWRFFPDKPAPNDTAGLGFGREHPGNDPELTPMLESQGYGCVWSSPSKVAERLRDRHQVFYDEDGKYLCSAGRVLLIRLLAR